MISSVAVSHGQPLKIRLQSASEAMLDWFKELIERLDVRQFQIAYNVYDHLCRGITRSTIKDTSTDDANAYGLSLRRASNTDHLTSDHVSTYIIS